MTISLTKYRSPFSSQASVGPEECWTSQNAELAKRVPLSLLFGILGAPVKSFMYWHPTFTICLRLAVNKGVSCSLAPLGKACFEYLALSLYFIRCLILLRQFSILWYLLTCFTHQEICLTRLTYYFPFLFQLSNCFYLQYEWKCRSKYS